MLPTPPKRPARFVAHCRRDRLKQNQSFCYISSTTRWDALKDNSTFDFQWKHLELKDNSTFDFQWKHLEIVFCTELPNAVSPVRKEIEHVIKLYPKTKSVKVS
ncbi:hypothetical protein CCR75_001877 [Bremia lactucae]|uniref:Uncharacterized protein n=1 Tax=Bremia lactucae TaxID=4779 RepID=A0A976FIJ2_BRELC|nr:hypothetical protein CCR75_001877 [Bremia lactucae]